VTCPLDVGKTRIISRDKENQQQQASVGFVSPNLTNSDNHLSIFPAISENVVGDESYGTVISKGDSKNSSIFTDNQATISAADSNSDSVRINKNSNMIIELIQIAKEEGVGTLFLGFRQRLLYVGLANGIRLAAYGTSRMDLMMKSLDEI
jgi:hypothetical protein